MAVLILGTIVTLFGILLLVVSGNLGPKRRVTAAKMMPYECGIPGQETNDSKVSVKFYLTAILFILFDIEIIFMYPWAVTFMDFVRDGNGMYMLTDMVIFVFLFAITLFWQIKSGALDWSS